MSLRTKIMRNLWDNRSHDFFLLFFFYSLSSLRRLQTLGNQLVTRAMTLITHPCHVGRHSHKHLFGSATQVSEARLYSLAWPSSSAIWSVFRSSRLSIEESRGVVRCLFLRGDRWCLGAAARSPSHPKSGPGGSSVPWTMHPSSRNGSPDVRGSLYMQCRRSFPAQTAEANSVLARFGLIFDEIRESFRASLALASRGRDVSLHVP